MAFFPLGAASSKGVVHIVAVRSAPFLIGAESSFVMLSVPGMAILVVFEISLIEKPPLRQSFADSAARTIVANLSPVQPHRAVAGPLYSAQDVEFGGPPKRPPREELPEDR